jgi:serine/threonine-protein kinase
VSASSRNDPLRRALQEAVGGQYEIIRLLNRGGMGAVYLAGDVLERLVAIKVILPQAFEDERARKLFRKEMLTVARFEHPNIVAMYACGELDELDYFVMRYVSGDSIAERLEQERSMPPEVVRRILVQLADALHYAHGLGVVHRDVKPANVLIDDLTGHVFLTDFGVAKLLNTVSTQSSGTVAGTPGYMPPEAFNGGTLDHRADIYALGVLGYEMLAGRRPFDGDTPLRLIQQTLTTIPADLAEIAPEVPPDLAGVIMQCLSKDAAGRYADAHRLGRALSSDEQKDHTMPQDLRDMAGFGSWMLLWVTVWTTFGILKFDKLMLGIVLFVIALIVPTGFVLQTLGMRPAGLPLRQIFRVAFWPPKWWGMWWPRRLRRPVDLWPRLPVRARLTRITLSAFLVIVPLLIFLATESAWIGAHVPSLLPTLWVVIGVLAVGVVTVLVNAWMWATKQNLDGREIIRMLIGPTVVSGLWDSPRMLRLLVNHPLRVSSDVHEEPTYAHDCLDKIRRIEAMLKARSRESGYLAVRTGRPLCGEIDSLDRELADLNRDRDPDELARLEEELAGLAESNAGDSGERRSYRAIEREATRLREIELRLEAASLERTRLYARLLAIWHELAALSTLDPEDPAAEPIRIRIQRLCQGRDTPPFGAKFPRLPNPPPGPSPA